MANITEPTWMIHQILDEVINYHTHGLDKYDSLELELNINLPQDISYYILNTLGFMIANKEIKLEDGKIVKEVITCDLVIKETKAVNSDLNVFRVIVPDSEFRFPWDGGCEEPYKSQI